MPSKVSHSFPHRSIATEKDVEIPTSADFYKVKVQLGVCSWWAFILVEHADLGLGWSVGLVAAERSGAVSGGHDSFGPVELCQGSLLMEGKACFVGSAMIPTSRGVEK